MNPNDKGWFKDYLELRKNFLMGLSNPELRKTSHPDYTLYRFLQPTGLMYGQSVAYMDIPKSELWNDKEKLKILMNESLISSALLFYVKSLTIEKDPSAAVSTTVDSI